MREIEHLKRNCKKVLTMEEEIEHVASKLREEIQKATEIFDVWPPNEVPFLIITMNHLRFWLTLLWGRGCGTIRTKKHAYLGLCLKRTTGSKECLQWLNRSGHCISYDEVSKLFVFFMITYSDKFWRGFNMAQGGKWIFGVDLIWHSRKYLNLVRT